MLDLLSSVGKRKEMSMTEIKKLGVDKMINVAVALNSVSTVICDGFVKGLWHTDTSLGKP
jgi:hypothetical protein